MADRPSPVHKGQVEEEPLSDASERAAHVTTGMRMHAPTLIARGEVASETREDAAA